MKRLSGSMILIMLFTHLICTGREFRIVGYFAGDLVKDMPKVNFTALTHINVAFANPDSTGAFLPIPGLEAFVNTAHKNKVKVLIAIGGGDAPGYYKNLISPAQRAKLIAGIRQLAATYHLDGVDVDLEGFLITADYGGFVHELALALKPKYLLTAAIATDDGLHVPNAVLQELDFLNVMSYDKTGPWRPSKPGPHSPYEMAADDIVYWRDTRGMPAQQLNVGVPFYGHSFLGDKGASYAYKKIITDYPGAENKDELLMKDGSTVYYNGIATIRKKTALALREAGGVMIWQLMQDAGGDKSLLQAIKDVTTNNFQVRGFHLDLRIQVMKMPALKAFVKMLSEHGINTLIMEWEATYPFQEHRVIANQYAYTREEVTSFIAYCNQLKIDVIPLQQSFGHVEYILKHARYAALREDAKDYSQVNPIKEKECRALFADLYKDLISTHTSQYIHIGGDETMLLGHSPASKKKADSLGIGRLYGDYIQMLCELVVSLGKRPVVWADIALKYPDALKRLPKETIFIDWNYGWSLDRFGDHKKLQESGFEIWGAPAIRSGPDNYFLTSWQNHFRNISTFIPQARSLGYKGIIMTSWSTSGVYAPVFESALDAVDLKAVRRVYPITGFNLLISAFLEAIKTDQSLNTATFVQQYCKERYGFNPAQSETFLKAISTAPQEVGEGINIDALRDSIMAAQNSLKRLFPASHAEEFKHYQLMADIRAFYITCKWVEASMNKPDYRPENAPQLLKILSGLHPESLDARFIELNKDTYYLPELQMENEVRNTRYNQLKAILENKRSS